MILKLFSENAATEMLLFTYPVKTKEDYINFSCYIELNTRQIMQSSIFIFSVYCMRTSGLVSLTMTKPRKLMETLP